MTDSRQYVRMSENRLVAFFRSFVAAIHVCMYVCMLYALLVLLLELVFEKC